MDSKMQAAYQEFMLGKSKLASPAEKNHVASDYSGTKKKAHRPILRALQGRLEEWKETNQKLEGVLRSITNLRDRIYWESGCLNNVPSDGFHENTMCNQQQKEHKEQQASWRDCGFRSSFSYHNSGCTTLLKEDIYLGLDHDLLQHERMLSAVRSLLASLAQIVDEIGRRLDEWMLQNLIDQNDHISEDQMFVIPVKKQNTLELAQQVYSVLASDLYWKQKMAIRIFDSCHDGLLEGGDDNGPTNSVFKSDPRDVIKKSSKELSSPEHRNFILNLVNKLLIIA